jgi:hypothetical protein
MQRSIVYVREVGMRAILEHNLGRDSTISTITTKFTIYISGPAPDIDLGIYLRGPTGCGDEHFAIRVTY